MSIVINIDNYDLEEFLEVVRAFGQGSYGYVVTPNVDHIVRYWDDSAFRELCTKARYAVLDSRLLGRVLNLFKRIPARVCPGSDLTAQIFERLIAPEDRIVLVGGHADQADKLRMRYGLKHLRHIDPPMGFIRDPVAVEATLKAIENASPFRYCFLAIGSPQQELVANKLQQRGVARGLALCIGASINFMTGAERRAPKWMQALSAEWLFRLLQNPKRMAHRYLVRSPRIFLLLSQIKWNLRRPAQIPAEIASNSTTG
jgi:exopolysaccharide biosynthesis WecB/TagA/CpsF family protein